MLLFTAHCLWAVHSLLVHHRHVYGSAAKKELCIDNIKLSNNAWDTNLVAASGVRRNASAQSMKS